LHTIAIAYMGRVGCSSAADGKGICLAKELVEEPPTVPS
jgi:hypothetical protein